MWLREKCRAAKKLSGNFFAHGTKFRLFATAPKIYSVTAADLKTSNVIPVGKTLPEREMLANVGIAGNFGEPAPRKYVRQIQDKFAVYEREHDKLAVFAVGRWYASEAIQVSVVQ